MRSNITKPFLLRSDNPWGLICRNMDTAIFSEENICQTIKHFFREFSVARLTTHFETRAGKIEATKRYSNVNDLLA